MDDPGILKTAPLPYGIYGFGVKVLKTLGRSNFKIQRSDSGSSAVKSHPRPGGSLNVIKKTLENRSRKKHCFGAQVAGNVAKMTPKGTQNGTNIGLRGQLFGFWANCVFVQHYNGLAIF